MKTTSVFHRFSVDDRRKRIEGLTGSTLGGEGGSVRTMSRRVIRGRTDVLVVNVYELMPVVNRH